MKTKGKTHMKNKEKSQEITPETYKKIIEKHPEITPDVPDNRKFCRISLPYVLQKQKDGSLKPIGFLSDKWVEYAEYPIRVRFKGLTPEMIGKISIQGHTEGDIYLYDDNCVPTSGKRNMTAYLGKLAILIKLEVY